MTKNDKAALLSNLGFMLENIADKAALLSNLGFILENIAGKETERIEFALDVIYENFSCLSTAKLKKFRKDLVDLMEEVDAHLA